MSINIFISVLGVAVYENSVLPWQHPFCNVLSDLRFYNWHYLPALKYSYLIMTINENTYIKDHLLYARTVLFQLVCSCRRKSASISFLIEGDKAFLLQSTAKWFHSHVYRTVRWVPGDEQVKLERRDRGFDFRKLHLVLSIKATRPGNEACRHIKLRIFSEIEGFLCLTFT